MSRPRKLSNHAGTTMKSDEIKKLNTDELKKRIADEEQNLAHLRFQLATSQLESPIKVRTVRRDIARMKTALRMQELNATRKGS